MILSIDSLFVYISDIEKWPIFLKDQMKQTAKETAQEELAKFYNKRGISSSSSTDVPDAGYKPVHLAAAAHDSTPQWSTVLQLIPPTV